MNQSEFVETNTTFWQQSENDIDRQKYDADDLPSTYRTLTHHLALCQSRSYSQALTVYLQQLVLKYHNKLYSQKKNWFVLIWVFFYSTFPNAIRTQMTYVLAASACFFIPLLLSATLIFLFPESVYYLLSSDNLNQVKEMYNPETAALGRERASDGDWYMFGYYIYNNTGIGFRTFAAGLLMGFGTVFFLVFNGVYIGAIAGYLVYIGYSKPFFSFVSGHSSFELIAIALSGAAGFMLGKALINPGNLRRKQALQRMAKLAIPIMQGAMSFFFLAAAIEAFWSSSQNILFEIKITTGVCLWLVIIFYFITSGKKTFVK